MTNRSLASSYLQKAHKRLLVLQLLQKKRTRMWCERPRNLSSWR